MLPIARQTVRPISPQPPMGGWGLYRLKNCFFSQNCFFFFNFFPRATPDPSAIIKYFFLNPLIVSLGIKKNIQKSYRNNC